MKQLLLSKFDATDLDSGSIVVSVLLSSGAGVSMRFQKGEDARATCTKLKCIVDALETVRTYHGIEVCEDE